MCEFCVVYGGMHSRTQAFTCIHVHPRMRAINHAFHCLLALSRVQSVGGFAAKGSGFGAGMTQYASGPAQVSQLYTTNVSQLQSFNHSLHIGGFTKTTGCTWYGTGLAKCVDQILTSGSKSPTAFQLCVLISDGVNNDPGSSAAFIPPDLRSCDLGNDQLAWYNNLTYTANFTKLLLETPGFDQQSAAGQAATIARFSKMEADMTDFCKRYGLPSSDCTARGIQTYAKSRGIKTLVGFHPSGSQVSQYNVCVGGSMR